MRTPLRDPIRFEPIFKDYLWGGRRLAKRFPTAPASGPIAEAWVLSDEPANPSRVATGPLEGMTLREIMAAFGDQLLGRPVDPSGRFPLLLKFLDAAQPLSVQVHPTDEQARRTNPSARGKTEAWVVVDAQPDSRIYAGLKPGVDAAAIRRALADKTLPETLHSFAPATGDCVFLRAGTVHAIGAGLLIFEVQQTSDITYRLYDWDRVDAKTGQPRPLHIEESLACTNFAFGPCDPVGPVSEMTYPMNRERLVECPYFRLWRYRDDRQLRVGAHQECRVIVCLEGEADLLVPGRAESLIRGDVVLLPAPLGVCGCRPRGGPLTLIEVGLPI